MSSNNEESLNELAGNLFESNLYSPRKLMCSHPKGDLWSIDKLNLYIVT
jgi:hypothetical protein